MSWRNQVIWSEGLFLRPQHFQQHTRYLEALVERRAGPLRCFPWGFRELKVDAAQLAVGKLAIESAKGVFPDGTPFDIPDDDLPPPPLDLSEDVRDAIVYLGLPVRRSGTVDVHLEGGGEGLARTLAREYDVRDAASTAPTPATLQVGCLRTRLLLQHDERAEYGCLGVAQVVEVRPDRQVVLKDDYVPPALEAGVSRVLSGFVQELEGLLHHRGEELAGRVSASGRGGAAEIADFLMLQAVNRYQPLISHLTGLGTLHPADLYATLVSVAGELSTFTSTARRPPAFPGYRHEDLRATFRPVIDALRESLSMVIERSAVPIPLKEKRFGIRVGTIADRTLVADATLVLAVNADIPAEQIRKLFPAQVKIGPVEKIRELVNVQLPGIALRALPVAPRQIPYHAGFVYFELDRANDLWKQLKDSGGIAIHVGGEYPGLQMELWGIRG